MCLQCYQPDDSRHSHQRTNESQNSNHDVIYIQGKQQWTEKSALRHTRYDRCTLTTTFCCLLHRNKSIHTKVFPHAISMEFAFQKFMRRSVKGLLEVQYKCIYLTSCIQNFGPIIYYCDQLSFTATILPENMLRV